GYEVDDVKVINNNTSAEVTVTDPTPIAKGGDFTFTMPDSAVTVQVIISPVEYAISYNTPANGTITDNDLTKDNTLEAKFTATPDTGYQIDKVEASYKDQFGKDAKLTLNANQTDVTKATIYTYQMPASNVAVNVTFKQIEYNVSLDSTIDLNGKADVTLNGATTTTTQAIFGSEVKVNVTPIVGYEVTSVVATDGAGDLTVTNPATAIAKGGEFKFTMRSSNVTVKVNMTPVIYNVSYNVPVNGKYDAQAPSFAFGSDATFTVTPAAGYQIETAKAYYEDTDGKHNITFTSTPTDLTTTGVYTYKMPASDVTVKVTFEKQPYTVTVNDEVNATIRLNDHDALSTNARYNDTVKVKVTPDTGYELTGITVKGATKTYTVTPTNISKNGGEYTFSMPNENVNVTVTIVNIESNINTFPISFTDIKHGTVTTSPATTAKYGDTVKVIADPDDGYRFKAISIETEDGTFVNSSYVTETANYVTTYAFTMPEKAVKVYVTFEEFSASNYTDVRTDDWFYDAVQFVSNRGYFNGIGGGLFGPEVSMNRGMFVTVLGRIAKVDTSKYTTTTFTDVNMKEYYGPYVQWANENKIVTGYGNDLFGPNDNVTREQMALIMYNYVKVTGGDLSLANPDWINQYLDKNKTSVWAKDAMQWAVSIGLVHGVSEGSKVLDPTGSAVRSHVAQIIKNLCDKNIFE
ncbi:MAG: S-layer homology domain-containing protein, partial [Clostridiales bacterium]